jgi:hypothetical protein
MKKLLPGILIILIAALAYLPLAHLLGFYNDDWYLLYMGLSQGAKRFMDVFAVDRPFRGYFVGWLFTLLGTHALWYSYAAFLARGLSALGLYQIMCLTWPREKAAAFLAALLLIIYPGFLDQPNAMDYQSHQWGMVLAVFSIFCTLKAFQPGTRLWKRILWLVLSVIQQLFSLLLMEYYIGLEGLRFLLVWQVTQPVGSSGQLTRLRQALIRYLPNLLVAFGFFIWRTFIFNSGRTGTDVDTMLFNVAESPIMRLLWMAVFQFKDLLNTLFLAWGEPLYQLVFTMRLKNILLAVGVGIAGAFLAWLLLRQLQKENGNEGQSTPENSSGTGRQMIWIGLLGVLCALLPVHLGNRSVWFDSYSRFTLPASLGAVLVFAGTWLQIRSKILRVWLPVALTGLAVMVHTGNTLAYVERWKLVKDFWWQVAWRAPKISQGTNLIASYADQGIAEDYFVWGPANLIYYPKLDFQIPTLLPLTAATLDKSNLQAVLAGRTEERMRRSILSQADFANTLVLSMPTPSSCVHILDGRSPELSAQDRPEIYMIAPYSRLESIQVQAEAQIPPARIFGVEPPHGWCYYYQKASLARQAEDWQEVARLGDEAQQQNLRPIDWVEWMPFVEAYAYTGQTDKVSQLAPILKDDLYLRYQTCHLIEQDGRKEADHYPEGHLLLIESFCQ